jgi:putative ABC transport system substrate-binding protein
MRRREFIALLGSAATQPLAARAQAHRRLGILTPARANSRGLLLDAFGPALQERGWNEGQNVSFEHRAGADNVDALTKLAAELVQFALM